MAELTKEAYFDWLNDKVRVTSEKEDIINSEDENEAKDNEIYRDKKIEEMTKKKQRKIKHLNFKQPKEEKIIKLRGKQEAEKHEKVNVPTSTPNEDKKEIKETIYYPPHIPLFF